MAIVFPNPANQTPVNHFSPTSSPNANTFNNVSYLWNNTDKQWQYNGPNVDPDSGTEITTPSISSPADGASSVSSSSNLTISSSSFAVTSGSPGDHQSSAWEIVKGTPPLVSTNAVTATSTTSQNYTQRYSLSYSKNGGLHLNGVWKMPNDDLYAIQSEYGSPQIQDYHIYKSTDDGVNWSDISSTPQGVAGGSNAYMGSGNGTDPRQYDSVHQVVGGTNDGDLFIVLKSNMHNFGRGWLYFDYSADSWSGFGLNQNFGGYPSYAIKGQFNNIIYFGHTNTTYSFDIDNKPSGSFPTGNINGVSSSMGPFARRGTQDYWFGYMHTANTYFKNTNNSDLSQMTTFTDSTFGTGTKNKVYWVSQIDKFLVLGSGGFAGTFDPDTDTFENLSTGTTQDLANYLYDGDRHVIVFNQGDGCIVSTDFVNWSVVPNYGYMVKCNNNYVAQHRDTSDMASDSAWRVSTATVFADQHELTISNANTDGFSAGDAVTNRGGVAASGTISGITSSAITLFPFSGTWSTQNVSIPTSSFSIVSDSTGDTSNLTSLTLNANQLDAATDYAVRVQYRTNNNCTSEYSDWSTFTTS